MCVCVCWQYRGVQMVRSAVKFVRFSCRPLTPTALTLYASDHRLAPSHYDKLHAGSPSQWAATTITNHIPETEKKRRISNFPDKSWQTPQYLGAPNWAPVFSSSVMKGIFRWPHKKSSQQISFVTGAGVLSPCGVCVVCVWERGCAKELWKPGVLPSLFIVWVSKLHGAKVIHIQCTKV